MTDRETPSAALRRLVNGYQATQAIHVAAELGIADRLADGPRTSDELAAATDSHPGSLYRLLRALASIGVLDESDGRRFALTALGECLRSDAEEPVGGWAALVGRPENWAAWGSLLHRVRTGENAFRHVHGTDVWDYRAQRPEQSAVFDRAMTDLTRRSNRALLDAYDFGRFATVVDVGGGRGALLAALLARHPAMRGILFDREHVVAGAGELLDEAGVADRCRVVAGSFFDEVPAGGDAYVLKAIVHDWEDAEAVAILGRCRSAVPAHGVLLVVEQDLGGPNERLEAKLGDLNMLVAPGGRERSRDEYGAVFAAGGFELVGVTPSESGLQVIEGVPA